MNKTANLRRIQNEINQIKQQSTDNKDIFTVEIVNDDIFHWEAWLNGPQDSLYSGFRFKLDIVLPENYPYAPINIKFITPIQHVNINTNGNICLDILKTNWTPSQNIQSVIMSIGILLSHPNPDDALNSDLANLYRTSKAKYIERIQKACVDYAIPNGKD